MSTRSVFRSTQSVSIREPKQTEPSKQTGHDDLDGPGRRRVASLVPTLPRGDALSWTLRRPSFGGRAETAKKDAGASKTRHPAAERRDEARGRTLERPRHGIPTEDRRDEIWEGAPIHSLGPAPLRGGGLKPTAMLGEPWDPGGAPHPASSLLPAPYGAAERSSRRELPETRFHRPVRG
jgi:hypothetical protein